MTFKKFEAIFRTKYPDGDIAMHGKAGGTEKNKKVFVAFVPGGKAYMYYGAYEDILCKMGFKVISKERFAELQARLAWYKDKDGKPDFFGGVCDYKADIERYEKQLEQYKAEYIIA